jgi:hypothetical protein
MSMLTGLALLVVSVRLSAPNPAMFLISGAGDSGIFEQNRQDAPSR